VVLVVVVFFIIRSYYAPQDSSIVNTVISDEIEKSIKKEVSLDDRDEDEKISEPTSRHGKSVQDLGAEVGKRLKTQRKIKPRNSISDLADPLFDDFLLNAHSEDIAEHLSTKKPGRSSFLLFNSPPKKYLSPVDRKESKNKSKKNNLSRKSEVNKSKSLSNNSSMASLRSESYSSFRGSRDVDEFQFSNPLQKRSSPLFSGRNRKEKMTTRSSSMRNVRQFSFDEQSLFSPSQESITFNDQAFQDVIFNSPSQDSVNSTKSNYPNRPNPILKQIFKRNQDNPDGFEETELDFGSLYASPENLQKRSGNKRQAPPSKSFLRFVDDFMDKSAPITTTPDVNESKNEARRQMEKQKSKSSLFFGSWSRDSYDSSDNQPKIVREFPVLEGAEKEGREEKAEAKEGGKESPPQKPLRKNLLTKSFFHFIDSLHEQPAPSIPVKAEASEAKPKSDQLPIKAKSARVPNDEEDLDIDLASLRTNRDAPQPTEELANVEPKKGFSRPRDLSDTRATQEGGNSRKNHLNLQLLMNSLSSSDDGDRSMTKETRREQALIPDSIDGAEDMKIRRPAAGGKAVKLLPFRHPDAISSADPHLRAIQNDLEFNRPMKRTSPLYRKKNNPLTNTPPDLSPNDLNTTSNNNNASPLLQSALFATTAEKALTPPSSPGKKVSTLVLQHKTPIRAIDLTQQQQQSSHPDDASSQVSSDWNLNQSHLHHILSSPSASVASSTLSPGQQPVIPQSTRQHEELTGIIRELGTIPEEQNNLQRESAKPSSTNNPPLFQNFLVLNRLAEADRKNEDHNPQSVPKSDEKDDEEDIKLQRQQLVASLQSNPPLETKEAKQADLHHFINDFLEVAGGSNTPRHRSKAKTSKNQINNNNNNNKTVNK
jgi:hypothetical protein